MPCKSRELVQLNLLSKTDNELEVEVRGETETLLNPIKQALLADKDVDFAEYIIEHPSLSVPKIFIRTKGKVKPDVVLKRTIKALVAEFDEFENDFVAQLKKRN
jgi:DNA-directed RNA polymerase subunit L